MGDPALERRFLVLAPTGRDAELTRRLLAGAGLDGVACRDVDELCAEAARGAAGILVAEEVLVPRQVARLARILQEQEPWSDLPVLIFTGERAAGVRGIDPTTVARLGNVTLLDRPLRPITMLAAARSALRARRRQYAARGEIERQRAAVQQRDAFLAMLGHELRNPLATIALASDLLQRTGDIQRHGDTIRRQVGHLKRLVDDLLDVARVTTGKVVLDAQEVDVDELVERVSENLRPRLGGRELAISVRPGGERSFTVADPVRLAQVVENLPTNAVKYSDEDARIEVSVAPEPSWVVIVVRDEGFGIAADMLPRVFELFAQADETAERAQGGLGIGLTLVRSLVEQHGGTVAASSPGRGAGSTFTVRLPRLRAPAPSVRASEDPLPPVRRRVLLVEDQPEARDLLQELVELLGHDAEAASDGEEAVERALALRPDTMLVDIGLPRLDGYEVARRVRSDLGDDVVLVALTGYGQPEDRRRALEAGFDLHWTKPVDVDALARLLSEEPGRAPPTG